MSIKRHWKRSQNDKKRISAWRLFFKRQQKQKAGYFCLFALWRTMEVHMNANKIAKTALKKGAKIEKDLEIFCSSILHGQVRGHRPKQDSDEETDFFPGYEFHIEGHIRYSPEGKETS